MTPDMMLALIRARPDTLIEASAELERFLFDLLLPQLPREARFKLLERVEALGERARKEKAKL